MHTFKQTKSGMVVGLRFLLHGQEQSHRARLNVFLVFRSAELGTRDGPCCCCSVQAQAGSNAHTYTLPVKRWHTTADPHHPHHHHCYCSIIACHVASPFLLLKQEHILLMCSFPTCAQTTSVFFFLHPLKVQRVTFADICWHLKYNSKCTCMYNVRYSP